MLGAPGKQPLGHLEPRRRDRQDRRPRSASRPDRSRRSNSTGGRPPPKCTYLKRLVRMTARLHWRESMPKCVSAVRSAIERKSNSQCAASRQSAGFAPSRNGASERPSRCAGTSAPSRSSAVGRMSTASVNASTVRPACLLRPGIADDQRDVVAAVEEAAFAEHEMVAHHLGMVRGEDDDRVVPGAVVP